MIISYFIYLLAISITYVDSQAKEILEVPMAFGNAGTNIEVPLPVSANYRRECYNPKKSTTDEHLYRVCNGKNKAKCGFWEDVKTKKKVPSGTTVYNKKKKALIIRKSLGTDDGTYMTGNKKHTVLVRVFQYEN